MRNTRATELAKELSIRQNKDRAKDMLLRIQIELAKKPLPK